MKKTFFTAHLVAQMGDLVGGISSLAFDPSGQLLVLASEDGQLEYRAVSSGSVIWQRETGEAASALSFCAKEGWLAASASRELWIWMHQGTLVEAIKQPGTTSLTFVADRAVLVSVTSQGELFLWQIAPARSSLLHYLVADPAYSIGQIHALPHNRLLTLGKDEYGERLHLWQIEEQHSRSQLSRLPLPEEITRVLRHRRIRLFFHSLTQTLFLFDWQKGNVLGWCFQTEKQTLSLELALSEESTHFALSPDRRRLAVGHRDGRVSILDICAQRPLLSFAAHQVKGWESDFIEPLTALEWRSTSSGEVIITAGWHRWTEKKRFQYASTLRFWRLST